MLPARARRSRRTVLATGLLTVAVTAALPVGAAFADDPISLVQPATVANGDVRTITFTTPNDTWPSISPPQVTITRANDPTHSDVVEGSGESVSSSDHHKVTASFDLKLANPASYAVTITGTTTTNPTGSTTASCASCLTVVSGGGAPTATSVAPNTVTADDAYPNWAIAGTNFTEGPYVQCKALPCDPGRPNVAVLDTTGALDPNVLLSASDKASTAKQIPLELSVLAADTGGLRTIQVMNTDGQVGTCTNCLSIAPAMSVTSVSPNHLPSGSSGQTLVITGANFPADVQPTFVRESDGTTTGDVAWTAKSVSSSQIVLSNVSISSSAPDGNQDLVLHSDSTHGNSTFPGVFAVGGSAPVPPSIEGTPTNVKATGGDQQAFVQWTPPGSTSSDPITGYVVRTLPSGDPSSPAPPSASSAAVGPLTNGQSYQFYVVVTYQSGHSYTSAASNAVTPSGKPDAPTAVQATAGDKRATVTWQPPASSNGTPVDSYTVTSSPDGIRATVYATGSSAPATTAVVSGLKNGTRYTFTVVAHNQGGNSDDSNPSNTVTPIGDPSLSLHAPKAVDKGTPVHLHGQLVNSNGKPVAGASVKLQQRHAGAHKFGTLKVLKTSKSGRWSFDVKPRTTTRYRVRWGGDAGDHAVRTGHTVHIRETGRITSPKDGAHVSAGSVTVRGIASTAKGSAVALQERRGGSWSTIARGTVGAHHRVRLSAVLGKGSAVLRLRVNGALGTTTGHSAPVTVHVS